MSNLKEWKSQTSKTRIARIAAKDLKVHPTAQRPFQKAWGKRLAQKLDLDMLGVLVGVEERGHVYIIDGQHRLFALKERGLDEWVCTVQVYEDVDPHTIFVGSNDHRPVSALATHRALVLSSDDKAEVRAAKHLEAIVVSEGFAITNNNRMGAGSGIPGVAALQQALNLDNGVSLKRALSVARNAWGKDSGIDSRAFQGLAVFLHAQNGTVNDSIFASKLAKYGPASRLTGDAKAAASTLNLSLVDGYVFKLGQILSRR